MNSTLGNQEKRQRIWDHHMSIKELHFTLHRPCCESAVRKDLSLLPWEVSKTSNTRPQCGEWDPADFDDIAHLWDSWTYENHNLFWIQITTIGVFDWLIDYLIIFPKVSFRTQDPVRPPGLRDSSQRSNILDMTAMKIVLLCCALSLSKYPVPDPRFELAFVTSFSG